MTVASLATLGAFAIALLIALALLRWLGRWALWRWQLQRSAGIAQHIAAVLWMVSVLGILVLGFIKPRLLPEAQRSIPDGEVSWMIAAALVALLTTPLAWRGIYRLFHRQRAQLDVEVRVPALRVAALCALSLAVIAVMIWQASRHGPMHWAFLPLYVVFFFSLVATVPPVLHWALGRLRDSSSPN